MAKKQAFTHDLNARNDARLVNVRMHHGMAGIGIYWCIIEMMYESTTGHLETATIDDIAVELCVAPDLIRSVVCDFGLFLMDETTFWSPTAVERMERQQAISEKRRMAGRRGGAPIGNTYAKRDKQEQQETPEQDVQPIVPESIPETPAQPVDPPAAEPEKPKRKVFVKPTIEQVQAEITAKGYHIDAQSFVAFYESKGWMVGKNHMKSWKAALVTWEKRRSSEQVNKPQQNNNVNDIWQ